MHEGGKKERNCAIRSSSYFAAETQSPTLSSHLCRMRSLQSPAFIWHFVSLLISNCKGFFLQKWRNSIHDIYDATYEEKSCFSRKDRCILSDIRTEEMMEVSFARKQPVRQLACIHISCEKCIYAPFAHYVGRTFGVRGKMQFWNANSLRFALLSIFL